MAIYDYHCQACGATFDKLVPYRNRDLISCHDCGAKVDRKEVYAFSHYWKNFITSGTQGGEGFTSTKYGVREVDERVKYKLHKGDKV